MLRQSLLTASNTSFFNFPRVNWFSLHWRMLSMALNHVLQMKTVPSAAAARRMAGEGVPAHWGHVRAHQAESSLSLRVYGKHKTVKENIFCLCGAFYSRWRDSNSYYFTNSSTHTEETLYSQHLKQNLLPARNHEGINTWILNSKNLTDTTVNNYETKHLFLNTNANIPKQNFSANEYMTSSQSFHFDLIQIIKNKHHLDLPACCMRLSLRLMPPVWTIQQSYSQHLLPEP